jgi:hypothetical protein
LENGVRGGGAGYEMGMKAQGQKRDFRRE